jgi:multidrug resistance efflux pump
MPLEDFDRECLKELATAFAHDIKALTGHPSPGSMLTEKLFRRPKRMAITAAVALAALLFPVRQNSLGTAEVTPLSYSVISAPLDGVIASVPVNPNDQVARGQVLFRIDDASIRNRLAAARSSMGVAQSEAFLSQQKAFLDPQARSEVATYQARVREKGSSIEYLSELRRKTEVTAPSPGVVLFGDKTDWEGKPVTVGERVMTLADRGSAGVTVWIPAADAINLEKGARVKLFLHTDPLHVRDATVIRSSYQPVLSPEGIAAYRVTAGFTEKKDLPRLGLRGTAKVYGGRVTLAYYVFRRPVAKLRQWMGL